MSSLTSRDSPKSRLSKQKSDKLHLLFLQREKRNKKKKEEEEKYFITFDVNIDEKSQPEINLGVGKYFLYTRGGPKSNWNFKLRTISKLSNFLKLELNENNQFQRMIYEF